MASDGMASSANVYFSQIVCNDTLRLQHGSRKNIVGLVGAYDQLALAHRGELVLPLSWVYPCSIDEVSQEVNLYTGESTFFFTLVANNHSSTYERPRVGAQHVPGSPLYLRYCSLSGRLLP